MSKVNVLWIVFSCRMNVKSHMGSSWRNKIKMLWSWPWRILKTKMHAKEEVLFVWSQFQWRISKINSEVCHGKFQVQLIFKRQDGNAYKAKLITLNAKKRTSLQFLEEIRYRLRMEKAYFKPRRIKIRISFMWINKRGI